MKKKWLGLLFASALALTACGGQKPVKNVEFEEFSAQVSAVMYDIGLTSAPPETTTPTKRKSTLKQSGAMRAADTYESNEGQLWSTVEGLPGVEEYNVLNAYQDVFEQSFYIPLIMGDALRTYYGAEKFYGVSAKSPWEQYVRTDKDGTKKTTFVYTPAGEIWDKETFIVMELDFRSQDDYEVQCKQFSVDYSSRMFAYLDSDGRFLQVSHEDGNPQNSYIAYCADGIFGYRSLQGAEGAIALLQGEFTQVNQEDVRSIQTKSQYSVDEKKWEEISATYFENNGPTIVYYHWLDEAQTILQGYTCHEPIEEIIIPARARYLFKDFFIDMDEGIAEPKRLVIPKTVVGVKDYDPNTPENMPAQYVDVSVDQLRVSVEYYVPLQEIVVEEGSTIFESGEGHLQDKAGNVLTYVNAASPSATLDLVEFVERRQIHVDRLEYYPSFCASVQRLMCKSDEFAEAFMELSIMLENRLFPNLTDVEIACKDTNVFYNWYFQMRGDLRLEIDVPSGIRLDVPCPNGGALEVVVKNVESKLHLSTDCQQLTVRVPWSKKKLELDQAFGNGETAISGVDESKIVYAEETEVLPVGVDVVFDGWKLVATLDGANSADITLPASYYSYPLQEVSMRVSGEHNVFRLPSTVQRIAFEGLEESNGFGAGIVVYFDGTRAQFAGLQTWTNAYRIHLICDDYDGWLSKGVKKIVFYNNLEEEHTHYVYLDADGAWWFSSDRLLVDVPEDRIGVYVDEQGREYNLRSVNETWYSLSCPPEYAGGVQDLVLTYQGAQMTAVFNLMSYLPDGTSEALYYNEEMPFGTQLYASGELVGEEYILTITIEFAPVGNQPALPMEVIVKRFDASLEFMGIGVYGEKFTFEQEGTYYVMMGTKAQ